jgi:hypothetical protein
LFNTRGHAGAVDITNLQRDDLAGP